MPPPNPPLLPRSLWCNVSRGTQYTSRRRQLHRMRLWTLILSEGFDLLGLDVTRRLLRDPLPALAALTTRADLQYGGTGIAGVPPDVVGGACAMREIEKDHLAAALVAHIYMMLTRMDTASVWRRLHRHPWMVSEAILPALDVDTLDVSDAPSAGQGETAEDLSHARAMHRCRNQKLCRRGRLHPNGIVVCSRHELIAAVHCARCRSRRAPEAVGTKLSSARSSRGAPA